jgi:hypothetical protein
MGEFEVTIKARLNVYTGVEGPCEMTPEELAHYVAETFVLAALAEGTDGAVPGETAIETTGVWVDGPYRADAVTEDEGYDSEPTGWTRRRAVLAAAAKAVERVVPIS